jgi:uncharacterized protein (TIGR02996 family)
MLHTHDEFLSAIESQPSDRTLRLVFADWLDEQSDPRGELIRIEEEMRALPVFSDRFWELKPRRNALREQAGTEWCGRMRYGTECEPVFRHGIPDGWRERWRLIREFTERWHRVPMPDVGGRQKEIAEAETRLGRKLPPSVREWIAYDQDTRIDESYSAVLGGWFEVAALPGQVVSLFGDAPGNKYGIRHADAQEPDPPVDRYIWDGELGIHNNYAPAGIEYRESSVTNFVFRWLLMSHLGHHTSISDYLADEHDKDHLLGDVEDHFPVFARWSDLDLYETNNVAIAFWDHGRGQGLTVLGRIASHVPEESLPAFLREFIAGQDGQIPF